MTALFVTPAHAVNGGRGGVQLCTDEFIRAFRAGGLDVNVFPVERDRRLRARLKQRLVKNAYGAVWHSDTIDAIAQKARAARTGFVMLNLVDLAPIAADLKAALPPTTRLILLSHGLESVDYLQTIDGRAITPRLERDLGSRLLAERAHRRVLDHVFCLAPFEAEIERWIGARAVTAVPRTIPPLQPLDWMPDTRRLGFVGTLDHPPSWQGLRDSLASIVKAGGPCEIRIVGAPESDGRALASTFPIARYLGPLNDANLAAEAATWSAFLHPMFCWSRGCSTKLAVALAWQIPIVTTAAGARGYSWKRGNLPMAETPDGFAVLALSMLQRSVAEAARREVVDVCRSSPTVGEVGRLLVDALQTADPIHA